MKRNSILITILILVGLVSGCSTISQSKAEELIREEYSDYLGEEATIISTEKDVDGYIIEWENKSDKHRGTSKVSVDGEITIIYAEIE